MERNHKTFEIQVTRNVIICNNQIIPQELISVDKIKSVLLIIRGQSFRLIFYIKTGINTNNSENQIHVRILINKRRQSKKNCPNPRVYFRI